MSKNTDLQNTCANCSLINCIDLFRHTKNNDEFTGGELYVYNLLRHDGILNEELGIHTCSNGVLYNVLALPLDPLIN